MRKKNKGGKKFNLVRNIHPRKKVTNKISFHENICLFERIKSNILTFDWLNVNFKSYLTVVDMPNPNIT